MRVIFWGTYDTGKPRVRIMLRGLKEFGVEVTECHVEVRSGIEDKSQISSFVQKVKLLLCWFLSYPPLIIQFLRLPPHDAVVVGYMGQLDVLVLWPFAKVRGIPIVWDAFISLYDTVVEDRKIVKRGYFIGWLLYFWESFACRAADIVLLDTQAHADYFVKRFHLLNKKTGVVFVGAENEAFPVRKPQRYDRLYKEDTMVLFYGQFIPLHGVDTIVRAADLMRDEPVRWVLIGSGQEGKKVFSLIRRLRLTKIDWIPWVDYLELSDWICSVDICLGIFGSSGKAARVIPNKVFQVLSSGKPLITQDSPAIRELITSDMPGVFLVPSEDPEELSHAVRSFITQRSALKKYELHRNVHKTIKPSSIGFALSYHIRRVCR